MRWNGKIGVKSWKISREFSIVGNYTRSLAAIINFPFHNKLFRLFSHIQDCCVISLQRLRWSKFKLHFKALWWISVPITVKRALDYFDLIHKYREVNDKDVNSLMNNRLLTLPSSSHLINKIHWYIFGRPYHLFQFEAGSNFIFICRSFVNKLLQKIMFIFIFRSTLSLSHKD